MEVRRVLSICAVMCGSLLMPQQGAIAQQGAADKRNVIVVMTDGLRWQEVFRGADSALLTPENYYHGRAVKALEAKYLAATPETRRAQLMPFLWGTLMQQGQMYGDMDAGSDAHVTNGLNFSYPGYSETLTGHPDPRIDSNDNKPNPNLTVLEWLNKQPGLQGKVAAFGAWEVIGGVINAQRCGFTVNVSYDPLLMEPITPEMTVLNHLKAGAPRIWDDEVFDAPTFYTAMNYMKVKKPRVMFLSLGETDDWAHGGNYGEYLESAQRVDRYLEELWKQVQSMPEYRDNTTLVFLTDHGRGTGAENWKSHGVKLPESKQIFIGIFGAGVTKGGLQENVLAVTQNQVADTVAGYLGLNWKAEESKAGVRIAGSSR